MAQLTQVFNAILNDILKARAESDLESARIGEAYSKDKILRFFPIPRIEIKDLTIELKMAVKSFDKEYAEVIVEADKLKELPEASITTVRVTTTIKNYMWNQADPDDKGERKLIEIN